MLARLHLLLGILCANGRLDLDRRRCVASQRGCDDPSGLETEDEVDGAVDPPCYLVRPSDNVYSFFMFIGSEKLTPLIKTIIFATEHRRMTSNASKFGHLISYSHLQLRMIDDMVVLLGSNAKDCDIRQTPLLDVHRQWFGRPDVRKC